MVEQTADGAVGVTRGGGRGSGLGVGVKGHMSVPGNTVTHLIPAA